MHQAQPFPSHEPDRALAAAVEAHLLQDPGRRNVAALFVPGDLGRAAACLVAARSVLITTGFPQRGHRRGETDGPPGALVLAAALRRLGKAVRLAAEPELLPVLAAGAGIVGLDGVELGPATPDAAARRPCDCAVAIERPGRAADGHCYNMRGEPITDLVAPVEDVYRDLQRAGAATVAVGDGGNEIGMGKVADRVRRHVPGGERIGAACGCDCLLVAGNSNRGAYGLVAALSHLAGEPLLHTPEQEERLLAALARAGAIDGVTGHRAPSVDGVPAAGQAAWLSHLHEILGRWGRGRSGGGTSGKT